jgi:hypothetical protein
MFSAYRYLSDEILPSRNEAQMLSLAREINRAGRSIFGYINTFDPENLKTMKAVLQGFRE